MSSAGKFVAFGALILAAAAAVAAWYATHDDERAPPPEIEPTFEAPPAVRKPASANEGERGRAPVPTPTPPAGSAPDALSVDRARGQIDTAPGVTLLGQYELLVDSGSEPTRHYLFQAAERLVTIDLPPGRSVLSARADGLGSHLLVIERATSDAVPPFHLMLEPAGGLGGQALDARGAPLIGLPVALVATASREVRTGLCDSEGRYRFADIPGGKYRVAFGSADSPIAPVAAAEVVPGETREVPSQSMPELGEGEIRVTDRASQPVAGARVYGAGQSGGWIDGVSDAAGIVRARFLPAGTFFLDVAGDGGRTGQGPLEVKVGRIGRAVIQIRD